MSCIEEYENQFQYCYIIKSMHTITNVPSLAKVCYQQPTCTSLLIRSFWSNSRLYLMTPTLLNCCLWSGLSLNHIEFCARLMCIVIDGCFLLLRVPIFHHKDYYFPTSMSVHTHLSFNLGSLRKVSTHCLTNVTVPYIFNAYLRTTFRITLARDWHIYISTI
jgi:hypothetical protein